MSYSDLFVEGKDDFHVIKNLLKKYDIPIKKEPKTKNQKKPEFIYVRGFGDDENYLNRGIENLKKTFKETIHNELRLSTIGIVIDADNDLKARWDSICDIARRMGTCDLPSYPMELGNITTIICKTRPNVKLGIWIMPDNENEGMLEHFVSDMISETDFLWGKAKKDVSDIPEVERLFSPVHLRKAEIHTWLAWQKTPGRPMGIGMTAGWFNPQAPLAQTFVAWIKQLFEIEL